MTEHKSLDNWFIGHVLLDDELIPAMPTIRGFVDGKIIPIAVLLWFDLDKKIAITDTDIYKIGKPNKPWVTNFLAAGNCIKDLEIKDVNH